MAGKYFLIDTTRCTACRGCQVACQEWNKLPATKTRQTGTHQNPPDWNGVTYRVVRFAEHPARENYVSWLFLSDACRHCLEPPCKMAADDLVPGAIVVDKNGAVIYTDKTKKLAKHYQEIKDACPWSVPQLDPRSGRLTKCHMCHDRVAAGLLPACVKACPTGCLNFGDEAQIKKLAEKHLAEAQQRYGDGARILDAEDVRALYLVVTDLEQYLKSA
jgi:formate dehydrogenase iron-sulfur subunit